MKATKFTLSLSTFTAVALALVPLTFAQGAPAVAQQQLVCPTPAQLTSLQLVPCYVVGLSTPAAGVAMPKTPTSAPLPELSLELPLVKPDANEPGATAPEEAAPEEASMAPEEPAPEEATMAPEETAPEEESMAPEEPAAEETAPEEAPAEETPQSPNEQEDCAEEEGGGSL